MSEEVAAPRSTLDFPVEIPLAPTRWIDDAPAWAVRLTDCRISTDPT